MGRAGIILSNSTNRKRLCIRWIIMNQTFYIDSVGLSVLLVSWGRIVRVLLYVQLIDSPPFLSSTTPSIRFIPPFLFRSAHPMGPNEATHCA